MNVASAAAAAMTGLTVPAAPAGAVIAGAIIPGAAAGVIAGGGTAGGAAGGGTAGGAANGAADPAVITGRTTEMAMITAAAPAAIMQTSVSELLLLPKVLKQPMPVRK